jgi:plastocyanin
VSPSTVDRIGACVLVGLLLLGAVVARASGGADALVGRVRVGGGPQKDVVVWLRGVPETARPAPRRVVLDQRNLTFLPHVLGVPAGTRVEMPNNDRVFHNVFSFKDGKRFDLGLYPAGTSKVVTFDTPGLSRIFCNIHPTMAAYVLAVDSAHVGVSDAEGRFEIAGVPPGQYEYQAWRPGASTTAGTVTVIPGREVEVNWP